MSNVIDLNSRRGVRIRVTEGLPCFVSQDGPVRLQVRSLDEAATWLRMWSNAGVVVQSSIVIELIRAEPESFDLGKEQLNRAEPVGPDLGKKQSKRPKRPWWRRLRDFFRPLRLVK